MPSHVAVSALFWPVLLLAALGCEPKCREVPPIAEVREGLRNRVDDRLDDADASDEQRARIQSLFTAMLPATERVRAVTLPGHLAIMAELKRDTPDRKRLAELIERNVDATQEYLETLVGVMLRAHALLTPEQRRELAERAAEPSEPLRSSFWLDRAVDYVLMRIDATDEQRRLVERIKRHLLQRGRVLQLQADALRAEAAAEFARDIPDRQRIDATLARGRTLARTTLVDLTGFYLLFAASLEPRQRALLNLELVRFEPCRTPVT
jgi:Spy/CpxP family protein refolding chaperone